jgi:hypothetical protein
MSCERILLNPNELKVRSQENECKYHVIFPSLMELGSSRHSHYSECSSSDRFFGIPDTINASLCLTSSMASFGIGAISSSTSVIVNQFNLSREERLNMIRNFLISYITQNLQTQDPLHKHFNNNEAILH